MKKMFKKNQVIITALALMLCAAGYLQFSNTGNDGEDAGDKSGYEINGAFVTSNGGDKGNSYITFNENAYLNFDETSQGIYIGSNTTITLNGGTIIAGTPIAMRSGFLRIPENANPTLIATGGLVYNEVTGKEELNVYSPAHAHTIDYSKTPPEVIKQSDHGSKLHIGHAILLESNGESYGGKMVSADIRSGRFLSYHTTPIGSYSIISSAVAVENTETHEYELSVTAYENRLTKFVKNCEFYG